MSSEMTNRDAANELVALYEYGILSKPQMKALGIAIDNLAYVDNAKKILEPHLDLGTFGAPDWAIIIYAALCGLNAGTLQPPQDEVWEPIETVPRDGTQVIVWTHEGKATSARYNAQSEPQATHWRMVVAPTEHIDD